MSVESVRRWARTGEGPPIVRFGHTVRYRRCDVEAWGRPAPAASTDLATTACEVVTAGGGGRPGVVEAVAELAAAAQLLDVLIRSAEHPSEAVRVVVEVDAAAWLAAMAARATTGHCAPLALPT